MKITTRDSILAALLAAVTVAVFAQLTTHAFLNYDDGQFIYDNAHVKSGDVGWALTSASLGWYPLTWLSHMLDWQLFGARAGGHLAVGLLLHIASALLLFFALRTMTGASGRSAFVAALFAIHPMHVESVAWASERKDTLSTLFLMIALLLYARARRPHAGVGVAMALSLMAKQMYVTLPFVLLLLDLWPLDRLREGSRLVREKIPLFVLTVIGCAAAVVGQRNLHALGSAQALPLWGRVANAAVAYVRYIIKLVAPHDLAVLYPLAEIETSTAVLAILLLLAISWAAWLLRSRTPYVTTGWFWFVGTLVPVIGIVQIGGQAMADRYTYVPAIGLFLIAAWGTADLARGRVPERIVAAAAAVVVAAFAFVAWRQTSYWKDSETLFTHAIEVTPPNALAEYSLGQALELRDPARAIQHLKESILIVDPALRADPTLPPPDWYGQAFNGIGASLLIQAQKSGRPEERALIIDSASTYFQRALQLDSSDAAAKANLALARQLRAKLASNADPQREASLLLDSGTALSMQGRFPEAVRYFERAVAIAPDWIEARVYLGLGLIQAGRRMEGVAELRKAESINPTEANDMLTKALQMPRDSANLPAFLKRYSK